LHNLICGMDGPMMVGFHVFSTIKLQVTQNAATITVEQTHLQKIQQVVL
jgi:hypothetical protein